MHPFDLHRVLLLSILFSGSIHAAEPLTVEVKLVPRFASEEDCAEIPIPTNLDKAELVALAKRCAKNDSQACQALAWNHITSGSESVGVRLLEKRCEMQPHDMACVQLGWVHLNRDRVEESKKFSKIACNAGQGLGCNNLGIALKEESMEEARHYFELACDAKNGTGCLNLAGSLSAIDPIRALGFIEKSCDLKSCLGCRAVAIVEQKISEATQGGRLP